MSDHYKCDLADAGPYAVWHWPLVDGYAAVVDSKGYNCLLFRDSPGAVFTTLDRANEIKNEWNKSC